MRKLICSLVLNLLLNPVFGQNEIYNTHNSDIYLRTGKIIKDVEIWDMNESKVEFVYSGNLDDVKINAVRYIYSGDFRWVFLTGNRPVKQYFDEIVMSNGSKKKGFIRYKGSDYIGFAAAENGKYYNVNQLSYIENKSEILQRMDFKNQPTKTEDDPVFYSKDKKNKDLIVTVQGDSILCDIFNISSNSLSYHIHRRGKDPFCQILKTKVHSYFRYEEYLAVNDEAKEAEDKKHIKKSNAFATGIYLGFTGLLIVILLI